ncbi:MAG: hypothetical protein V3W18_03840 [candidate division Zixibacteria bacterium]
MTNEELASLFTELADIMEIASDDFFKILAYRKAVENIEKLDRNIFEMSDDQIGSVPGIGKAIFEKIKTAVESGSFPTLEKWRASGYKSLLQLLKVNGVTPKKLANLLKSLRIESIDDIKILIDNGKFRNLSIIDEKMKDGILNYFSKTR